MPFKIPRIVVPGDKEPVSDNPLISGPIYSTTIKLALPVVGANFLNLFMGMADMIMVGQLGKEALASLVLSNSLMMLLFAIGFGVGFSTITHVSQHTGAGRFHDARRSASHALMFALLLGGLMILLGNLFLVNLLSFFNAEPRVMEFAYSFTSVTFHFMPFYFLLSMGIAVMQGLGDTMTPLTIMVFINIVNVLLNYILIFGKLGFPAMGVVGSATGTVIARGIGSLVIILFLISGRYRMTLALPDFRPHLSEFWSLIRLGIPNSLQSLMRNFNVMILYRMLSMTYMPTVAQASLGVGFQSESLAFTPLMGLYTAAGTMVGQNLGANRTDRAETASYAAFYTGVCLMFFACLAFLLIPKQIVSLFIHEKDVVEAGSWYLRINAIPQIFQSGFVLVGALRGAGDSVKPLMAHAVGQWLIRLPLAYCLIRFTGLEEWGMWLAMACSSCIESSGYFWLFRLGYWKKIRI